MRFVRGEAGQGECPVTFSQGVSRLDMGRGTGGSRFAGAQVPGRGRIGRPSGSEPHAVAAGAQSRRGAAATYEHDGHSVPSAARRGSPGRRMRQGVEGPCDAATCERRFDSRHDLSMMRRTGSRKLASRKPASNTPDTDLLGRVRPGVPGGSGCPVPPDAAPGLPVRACEPRPNRRQAYGWLGFQAVTGNSTRDVDTRPSCSYLHFTRTGSTIGTWPISFPGIIEPVRTVSARSLREHR